MTEHVLVCRLDNEGDVLLAGPAVRAAGTGGRRVTLLCGPRGEAAARLLPAVSGIVVHRAEWIDPEPPSVSPDRTRRLVDRLRRLSLDRAVVLTSWHQSPLPLALLLRLAGVPFVVAASEDYPGSLLDVRVRLPEDLHEVERGLAVARAAGCELGPGDEGTLMVRLPSGRLTDGLLTRLTGEGPLAVVHPGASASARRWSPERHRELVAALAAKGWAVAVTGAPAERPLTRFVAGPARKGVADLGGRTTFGQLGAVLSRASVVVVGNTGPAHLAASVGTPVVSLFAPTVPAVRWRPWRVAHVLLGDQDAACAGTGARSCPVPGHPCLEAVSVTDVLGAVESLTAGPPSALRAPGRRRRPAPAGIRLAEVAP